MNYVNVIIDNSSDHTDFLYTYGTEIPGLMPGDKVIVPFARGNKLRDAYVHSVVDTPEKKIKRLKYVIEKDPEISLSPSTIEVCCWMRERYFCRYIDAIKCFTPSGTAPKRRKAKPLFQDISQEKKVPPVLTDEQTMAIDRILPSIEKNTHRVFLIHGVTSSGKTEVYMRVVEECISRNKAAIMLVPEISLTTQTIRRFIGRFGAESIAVLHSKLSAGERYDQWMRIKKGQVKIVIGARSAIFAPFEKIGAIILDEEHETTYKSDMTPKYDTMEVAIQLGRLHNGVVVLGSATPSLSTTYRAEIGEYERIRLTKRYNEAPLPSVEIVDMREELKQGNKSIFSLELYGKINQCLEQKQQIILFLNRRGYSSFLSCRNCGYVMRCKDCNISLTYHKAENKGICHYCGYREDIPTTCPACGSKYIKHFGAGTEKVEEMAAEAFPQAVIDRLDMDTTKRKGSIEKILSRFAKGKTDILIGTQLVAKGLDFANVGLVGIISADISLNIPDYRSPERTFQLITQASGRAGRGDLQGNVIIQTYSPEHNAIQAAANQDYPLFYETEIHMRKRIGYPPYSDLIQLVLSATDYEEARSGAEKVKDAFLRRVGRNHGVNVLGPRPAQQALIAVKKKVLTEKEKEWIFSIDVNPYGFL